MHGPFTTAGLYAPLRVLMALLLINADFAVSFHLLEASKSYREVFSSIVYTL